MLISLSISFIIIAWIQNIIMSKSYLYSRNIHPNDLSSESVVNLRLSRVEIIGLICHSTHLEMGSEYNINPCEYLHSKLLPFEVWLN